MSNNFSFILDIFTRESYSPEQSTHIILKADVTTSLRVLLKVVFIIISLILWFKSIVLCFCILLLWCKYMKLIDIYLFISFSLWNTWLQILGRCKNIAYVKKRTIKIKCKGHPLINVNKKVDFKSLNFNNRYEIWQFTDTVIHIILN